MKRTNVVLDEKLLEEAHAISGEKTYSATINKALRELVRDHNVAGIYSLFGTGVWEGDLAEMRQDNPRRPEKPSSPQKPRGGGKRDSR